VKIFKYQPNSEGIITVPADYTLMHYALQNGVPTVWLAVDQAMPLIRLQVSIKATGQDVSTDEIANFIGTVIDELDYVWHLFLTYEE
jgi:hypothetical protein